MKIMVYCKSTKATSKTIGIALEHAKAFNASIDLVTSIEEKSVFPQEVIEKTTNDLDELAREAFTSQGIPCISKVIVTTLSNGEALVRYAEKNDIDAIIMTLKPRSRVGKIFFGSSTQYIILEAPCQVTTVKED